MFLKSISYALTATALALPAFSLSAQTSPDIPLEFYGSLPEVEEGDISPSGAHTALLMVTGGERKIVIFDRTGAPVSQLLAGDTKVRSIDWIGDEAILLLRSETDRLSPSFNLSKIEHSRANIIPLDGHRDVISVFADQRYVANSVVGFYGVRNVDGDWKGYFGGFRKGDRSGVRERILDGHPSLFEVDLRTGKVDLIGYPPNPGLYASNRIRRSWLVGDDGLVAATLDRDYDSGKWTISGPDEKKIASGTQELGRTRLVGLSADAEEIVYSVYNSDSGRTDYYSILADGSGKRLLWVGEDIDRVIYRPASARIEGFMRNVVDAELSDQDKQARADKVISAFPNSQVRVVDWTQDMSDFVARTSGKYDSGTWYRVDGTSGQRMMMGLERPAIQGPSVGPVRAYTYAAQDGLEIDAVLTLPPLREAKDLPVVVLPHGGPTSHDMVEFDWWAQAFASRGYAVLQPNFRGSTNRDDAFRNAGNGEWGRKMQTDISDGLLALGKDGIGDPSRACIVGASYGGYAALAGVTLQNGIYRCAVSVNGVTDLNDMFGASLSGLDDVFSRNTEELLGPDPDLKALSPRHQASRADAPVLLIHARDDTVVEYRQSVLMEDALKDAGKEVTLIALDGEDHLLSFGETRRDMLAKSVAFVEKHNPAD